MLRRCEDLGLAPCSGLLRDGYHWASACNSSIVILLSGRRTICKDTVPHPCQMGGAIAVRSIDSACTAIDIGYRCAIKDQLYILKEGRYSYRYTTGPSAYTTHPIQSPKETRTHDAGRLLSSTHLTT